LLTIVLIDVLLVVVLTFTGYFFKVYFFPQLNYPECALPGFITVTLLSFFIYATGSYIIVSVILISTFLSGIYFFFKYDNYHLKKNLNYRLLALVVPAVILIIANYQNALTSVFDTGAYHVVLIKWLREYGFVKGIANLDSTYGFISPIFFFGSLFEQVIWTRKSWQFVNGIIFIIHTLIVIRTVFNTKKKTLTEWGILFGYTLTLYYSRSYLPSTSPDLWVNLAIPYLFLIFYKAVKDTDASALTWLAICTLFTFWVKPSSLPLLLLPLVAFISCYSCLSKSHFIVMAISICFILGEMLYTNIIISGYLLFPVGLTKLNVSWAVPAQIADNLREHIYLWGITPGYSSKIDYTGFWWIKEWFFRNFKPGLYQHELIALAAIPFTSLSWFFTKPKFKRTGLVFQVIFVVTVVFWFYNSPNLRFLRPWIWTIFGLNTAVIASVCLKYLNIQFATLKYIWLAAAAYFILFTAMESGINQKLIKHNMWFSLYETPSPDFKTNKLSNGQIIHIPTDKTFRPWYIPLPSSRSWPVHAEGNIREGFRPADTSNKHTIF